jgi:hypothetical protein
MGISIPLDDDPFELGVEVVSAFTQTPFGAEIQANPGDIIYRLNGSDIYSPEDILGEIRELGLRNSLEVAFEYGVFRASRNYQPEALVGTIYFNPEIVGRYCPDDFNAFLRGGIATVMMNMDSTGMCRGWQGAVWGTGWLFDLEDVTEAQVQQCRRNRLEEKWLQRQLCPDSYAKGSVAGSFVGGMGSILGRGTAKRLLRNLPQRIARNVGAELFDQTVLTLGEMPPGADMNTRLTEIGSGAKLAIVVGLLSVPFD